MRKVYTTAAAELSYYKTLDYLQVNWSNTEHQNFEEQVQRILTTIVNHPFAYPATESNKVIRKAVILNVISMYYRVYDDSIEVLLFWDNRRNPEALSL